MIGTETIFSAGLELLAVSLGDFTTISSGSVSTTGTAVLAYPEPTPEALMTMTTAPTVMTAITNVNDDAKLLMVHDTFSYVESMSDEELIRADQLLSAKGLDLEFTEENHFEEQSKVFIKNI